MTDHHTNENCGCGCGYEERLVAQREEARRERDFAQGREIGMTVRAEAAEAALQEIVDFDCPEGWGGAGFAHVRSVARAALHNQQRLEIPA